MLNGSKEVINDSNNSHHQLSVTPVANKQHFCVKNLHCLKLKFTKKNLPKKRIFTVKNECKFTRCLLGWVARLVDNRVATVENQIYKNYLSEVVILDVDHLATCYQLMTADNAVVDLFFIAVYSLLTQWLTQLSTWLVPGQVPDITRQPDPKGSHPCLLMKYCEFQLFWLLK